MKKPNVIFFAFFISTVSLFFACIPKISKDENKASEDVHVNDSVIKNENNKKSVTAIEKYHSIDGQFKVLFSDKPKEKVKKVSAKLTTVNVHIISFFTREMISETVSYTEIPNEDKNYKESMKYLENIVNNTFQEGYTVTEKKKFEFDGHPAIQLRAEADLSSGEYLHVLANRKFYQISLFSLGDFPEKEEINAFLDSFELVEE